MDWYPLYNSLRIAAIACVAVFFTGIFAAYYVAKLPRLVKGLLDVVLTLPMVLPPTVVGYFLLLLFGVKRPFGIFLARFGIKVPMTWWSAVFAAAVVSFPLMYRTARGAFEAFDEDLADAGRTLGLSNTYIFWRVRMPVCRQGILAGTVLTFARSPVTPRAGRPPSPPRSTSSGAPTTRRWRSAGCWSTWPSRRWCCWP